VLTRKWGTSGGEQGVSAGTGRRRCACRVADCKDPTAHGGTARRACTQQRAVAESLGHGCVLDRPAQQQCLRGGLHKTWYCCNPSCGGCRQHMPTQPAEHRLVRVGWHVRSVGGVHVSLTCPAQQHQLKELKALHCWHHQASQRVGCLCGWTDEHPKLHACPLYTVASLTRYMSIATRS